MQDYVEFQFIYCAIKSPGIVDINRQLITFQFIYCAIKSKAAKKVY